MPTTVVGGGRECYDFCGRWGFDEAQAIPERAELAALALVKSVEIVCTHAGLGD
jgi:hypothetical protein